MSERQQDGGLEGVNTYLTHKKTRMNKQLKTEENSSGRILDYKEVATKTLQSSKIKDGHIKKYRKCFACITPCPSLELLDTRRNPLRGISPRGEKESGRTPASFTTVHVCRLCYRGLPQSSWMLILDNRTARSVPLCFYSQRLELLLR